MENHLLLISAPFQPEKGRPFTLPNVAAGFCWGCIETHHQSSVAFGFIRGLSWTCLCLDYGFGRSISIQISCCIYQVKYYGDTWFKCLEPVWFQDSVALRKMGEGGLIAMLKVIFQGLFDCLFVFGIIVEFTLIEFSTKVKSVTFTNKYRICDLSLTVF